ncbi:putative pirin family protein [Magnetofaba australis IT-1]|uniref:Putative pirin family protein n=2 Tax=Magnetofaba TaxID=1472292 RepID=A0A1Y2K484_9PROT|nr:putative pirin family protein [Magnetofaba australis IT-1]
MTAGSGLIHEEYHSADYAAQGGIFEAVQLWVNLPAKQKMTPPAYQALTRAQIPQVALPDGAGSARILAGELDGQTGPARTTTPMNVWDLRLRAGHTVNVAVTDGHTASLFVLHGKIGFDAENSVQSAEMAVLERAGSRITFTVEEDATVLLLSGQPIDEPIVGHGPFVMNSVAEIEQAMQDYTRGRMGAAPQ